MQLSQANKGSYRLGDSLVVDRILSRDTGTSFARS